MPHDIQGYIGDDCLPPHPYTHPPIPIGFKSVYYFVTVVGDFHHVILPHVISRNAYTLRSSDL